jgi:hypothetical protein
MNLVLKRLNNNAPANSNKTESASSETDAKVSSMSTVFFCRTQNCSGKFKEKKFDSSFFLPFPMYHLNSGIM